jgi:hypothetical protein
MSVQWFLLEPGVFKYVKSGGIYDAAPVLKKTLASVTRLLTCFRAAFYSYIYDRPANRWISNWRFHTFAVEGYCLQECDALYYGRYLAAFHRMCYVHHQDHRLFALRYRCISVRTHGMTTQTGLVFTFTAVSFPNHVSVLAGFEGKVYLVFRCKLNARMLVLMRVLSRLASIFEIWKSYSERSKFIHFFRTIMWTLQQDVAVHIQSSFK